ncbi:MAG: DNA topoisomerase IV subunit A [Bacilli bacterium]|nr:DNA topoisomerase IV subunit A [Bacilli bacterium]
MEEVIKKIYDYSLEEIMGESFGRYSKYIIQDRAIPDVRDGLKPVQRRILYSMYKEKNTYDKPTKKSANAVGLVMANYHPHGDSSIYEAIVRMSQWWKNGAPLVDMQGNNGSIDGDSAAASRYTEARLSKIAGELLRDIDKTGIVAMAPNYDDRLLEPTVLPSRFPNLLVNGTTGISAGYATNMPPHNLGEVIDATIFRIDNPNSRLETIMNYVKGPDFPTGGIALGISGIKQAYETGRGKIFIRAKTIIDKNKIIINEIPFEVNKSLLVRKIDEIRIDKKIDGIIEVRDESDKEGLQIAIDLKKDVDASNILNYLYKNTDLQISYNFNNVVIVNRRPMQLGLLGILDAYIAHQKEIVYKGTEYDLKTARASYHIMEGLIKAISILDEVIALIRRSKNKADAIANLVKEYEFTNTQAEAIVNLQLYRLTNTDVVLLEEEMKKLEEKIKLFEEILSNPDKLNSVIKDDLRKIKKEYAIPRRTEIREEIEEVKIDTTSMIHKEAVVVSISNDGYVKRVPLRSYQSSNSDEITLKENDYLIGLYNITTTDVILLFTNQGNYLYLPVYDIPEVKWKDLGKHISNIISLNDNEKLIDVIPVYNFEEEKYITSFSKNGMIKRTLLSDFKVQRYSKPIKMMGLKGDDELVSVTDESSSNVFIATSNGYGLWYDINEVPVVGIKASGVKAINLKDDYVVSGILFDAGEEYITILTDKGTGKRTRMTELEKTSRAKRGVLLMKVIKSNPSRIVKAYITNSKNLIGIVSDNYSKEVKINEIPIMDRYSNGSYVIKDRIINSYKVTELISKEDKEAVKEEIKVEKKEFSLKEIDDKLLNVDSIIKNIKE